MNAIGPKPQMNASPEAALVRKPMNDKFAVQSKRTKGNGPLDLSAQSSVNKEDESSSASADESKFSKVLEAKSTPSRSNASSPDNKNLSSEAKISTKSEPAPVEAKIAKSESSSSMVIAPGAENETEAVSREAAMQGFLQQMQSELGVEPEQILQAFAQLDVTDLTAPPEMTLEKVIGQLNLTPADAKKAEDMYAEMLALSATANMSEYLKAQNQTANLTALSPKQAAQKEMQKNIGAMSDSFFAKPQVQPQTLDGLKKAQGTQAYGKVTEKDRMAALGLGGAAAALTAQDAASTDALAKAGAGLEGFALPEGVESLSVEQQKGILASLKQELSQLEAMAPQAAGPEVGGKEVAGKLGEPAVTAAPSAMTPMAVLGGSDSSAAGFEKESDEGMGQDGQAIQVDGKNQTLDKLNNKGQFAVETPKAAKSDAQNNIQDVISQAQFLAKKGGGEMKVKMSPEGMGDIHLKVIVEKGQVNVEMIASNSEAKKLLEKGMDELKANLVNQKLHVDQIKVGGSSETSSQMQNQHQQDDGRFQQKFLQDFKDQNSAFRREIFDIGPARRPGSQIVDDAANSKFNPSKKRTSGSRRLDLVA